MIKIKNKKIIAVKKDNKIVQTIYKGKKLIWYK